MKEFEFIDHLRQRFAAHALNTPNAPLLGMGDDAAIVSVPAGRQVVVSTDMLVSDVHFFADDAAADIGAKALAVNLSDLAAMGADPAWFFLSVALPGMDYRWCDDFITGLLEMAEYGGIQLAGGDTTRGPLTITVTVMGLVEAGTALRRDGAQPGDLVVVSGCPGLAGLALQQENLEETVDSEARLALKRPQARLALGRALRGKATACIDVSDGLAADLSHLLKASGCGAEIRLQSLPQHPALAALEDDERWALQLGGGDDYELCFTLPPQYRHDIERLQQQAGIALQVIGETRAGSGLKLTRPDGGEFSLPRFGYEHFSE